MMRGGMIAPDMLYGFWPYFCWVTTWRWGLENILRILNFGAEVGEKFEVRIPETCSKDFC